MSDSISKTKLTNIKNFLSKKRIEFAENYDMSSYSSWKVGPIVKLVVLPDSLDELKIIIKTLIKEDINYILSFTFFRLFPSMICG